MSNAGMKHITGEKELLAVVHAPGPWQGSCGCCEFTVLTDRSPYTIFYEAGVGNSDVGAGQGGMGRKTVWVLSSLGI